MDSMLKSPDVAGTVTEPMVIIADPSGTAALGDDNFVHVVPATCSPTLLQGFISSTYTAGFTVKFQRSPGRSEPSAFKASTRQKTTEPLVISCAGGDAILARPVTFKNLPWASASVAMRPRLISL